MDLLFELGTEEIPARFLEETINQLKNRALELLNNSAFKFRELECWGTPRRLTIYAWDLEFDSSQAVSRKKGPPKNIAFKEDGTPTPALLGFLKKENGQIEDIEVQDGYVFLKKPEERNPREILSGLLTEAVKGLSFPKTMRWGDGEFSFVRPVRWVCALWGEEPLEISIFGMESTPTSYGLRFFSGPVRIERPQDYEAVLEENFVMVRPQKRRERLERLSLSLAMEIGGKPFWPEGLLEELVYLLEYPTPFRGSFPEEYLSLPSDVLITTMRHHQKHLPIVDPHGNLMNYFICFRNGPALGEDIVIRGNEQALTGRLEDARLFFLRDSKRKLIERVPDLKGILFYEKLGSLLEKTKRVEEISSLLCDLLGIKEGEKEKVLRTALLCKADLTTSLVQEFPELQGIMGREFAILDGEDMEVARGIADHYLPRFFGDKCPDSLTGTIVSLADRIDTLTCFFALGMEPSGSSDPLALRRNGQGLISILFEKQLPLDLKTLIETGKKACLELVPLSEEREKSLLEFLIQRLWFALEEEGYSFEEISCVIKGPTLVLQEVKEKAMLLRDLEEEELKNLVFSFKRIKNILKSAGTFEPGIKPELMEGEEKDLFQKVEELSRRDYPRPKLLLQSLLELSPKIGNFFEKIMVMVDDEEKRRNRLTILSKTMEFLARFGDFSALPF
ncbi:MAG: glycine--tRNA ligase subunit beta [Caldiserica bacterium]|nr:glycine--tRNA ligase subunit beta [Caldisericota bacterium]MDH7561925.1 glycine--tRNA ligase subunit beta [Caldisericota bacterium]